jgi:IMP dehydrogenase
LKGKDMKTQLCFDDVLLVPQYSDITSRKEISLATNIGKLLLNTPIVSSPMDTVTESEMAGALSNQGGLGIIHRYNSIENQVKLVRGAIEKTRAEALGHIGAAIGVTGDYIERAQALEKAGVSVICVDIAHGHHCLMRHALKTLRNTLGYDIHIMAGNVATLAAFNDLADWGANSIRVGIGGGSICSTRIQTGHGMPTLQSIINCSKSDRNACLIADGGIKNSGDIVKALASGADAVMLGSLLAGTIESPGEVLNSPSGKMKIYRGMASKEAQKDWRGKTSGVEGVSSTVEYKGPVNQILDTLEDGIRSGLSYSGCRSILELSARSKSVFQTGSGRAESETHIFTRQ